VLVTVDPDSVTGPGPNGYADRTEAEEKPSIFVPYIPTDGMARIFRVIRATWMNQVNSTGAVADTAVKVVSERV
jgi:hypothetical protein